MLKVASDAPTSTALCSVVLPGGLPAGTTEAEIEREFTKFGVLATVWVARKPPGFGMFHIHLCGVALTAQLA